MHRPSFFHNTKLQPGIMQQCGCEVVVSCGIMQQCFLLRTICYFVAWPYHMEMFSNLPHCFFWSKPNDLYIDFRWHVRSVMKDAHVGCYDNKANNWLHEITCMHVCLCMYIRSTHDQYVKTYICICFPGKWPYAVHPRLSHAPSTVLARHEHGTSTVLSRY